MAWHYANLTPRARHRSESHWSMYHAGASLATSYARSRAARATRPWRPTRWGAGSGARWRRRARSPSWRAAAPTPSTPTRPTRSTTTTSTASRCRRHCGRRISSGCRHLRPRRRRDVLRPWSWRARRSGAASCLRVRERRLLRGMGRGWGGGFCNLCLLT